MKHIKIVFTLTLVVLVASVLVFYVEGFTTPIIDDYNFEQANLAKFEVLPGVDASDNLDPDLSLDFTGTSITELIIIPNKGYIYTAVFQGFQSQITYMIGIDLDGNITGYKALIQGDTPGLGAEIGADWYKDQFPGTSIDNISDIDGLAGASITFGSSTGSLLKVIDFHKSIKSDGPVETPEEKLARWKVEISFTGAIITDVTDDYTLSSGVTQMEMASDGTDDLGVVYTAEFVGFQSTIEYIVAVNFDGEITGFKILSQGDTPGLGGEIESDSFAAQFPGMTTSDAHDGSIDGLAGATITTGAFKASLNDVMKIHQTEFEGVVTISFEEKVEALIYEIFPSGKSYTDVTRSKLANHDITAIYDVYDVDSTYLGVVYFADIVGASFSETTYIQFLLGIDETDTVVGFRMIDDNETPSKTTDMYLEDYQNSYIGDSADSALVIDTVAGSTLTSDVLEDAANLITNYHMIEYLERPDSETTSDANLLLAFPGVATFTSIYVDSAYDTNILNIYEARDGASQVLGYVYYGHSDGFGSPDILFTWGINVDDTTVNIAILNETESWDNAVNSPYDPYDGSAGLEFNTSTWLNNFVGLDLDSNDLDGVDAVSGVSTTTGPLLIVLEFIAQYHFDESVGGGN